MSLTQSGGYFIDAITFEAPTIPEQHVDISDGLPEVLPPIWAYMMTYRQDRRIRGRATHSGQRHTLGKT